MPQLEVLRGASMRYPGITAQRLRLDYSGMVSAYWYDLNMTNPDPERADLPRLAASDVEGLRNMKADFMALFEESSSRSDIGDNRQGRYILSDIAVLLNLYIDYGDLDVPTAIEKFSAHYLIAAVPESTADRMIHGAFLTVMNKICSTLFYVRHLILVGEDETDRLALEESKLALKSLIAYAPELYEGRGVVEKARILGHVGSTATTPARE
ncbi:hypothetical protein BGZ57DRAFT_960417 [Hyaloscypha finlandica]|nr:hypothetical protein BGZ57DRAFT_960417 [Hyaloscypha finlandica]